MTSSLKVNGKKLDVSAEPDTPLLWLLRGELKMTGTKFGCGLALCGACKVHVDGVASRACITPISALGGKDITTIEGLQGAPVQALRAAWAEADVVQCGYCQSGRIMSACALLKATPAGVESAGHESSRSAPRRVRHPDHHAAQRRARAHAAHVAGADRECGHLCAQRQRA